MWKENDKSFNKKDAKNTVDQQERVAKKNKQKLLKSTITFQINGYNASSFEELLDQRVQKKHCKTH